MSTENHLKRISEILWDNYQTEIEKDEDWFYACKNWEFNFVWEKD